MPYIISHLRIHEYLVSNNFIYSGNKKERAEIYLTNTLNNKKAGKTKFLINIDDEADFADKVKNNTDVMVIMGNPPYSNYSQNKAKDENGNLTWIGKLVEEYKPKGEKKINLDDDYIKFIRFACWKLESISKGVIGIITNNSFLNGITHRKMRKVLLNSFDDIYIFNLHGNSNIGETCPDGSPDNNVFDIKDAGVSINFFIKNNNNPNKQAKIYYYDLYGKQKDKYNFLYENNLNSLQFEEVNYQEFNNEFLKTKWGNTISDVGEGNIKLFDDGLNFFIPNRSADLIKTYGDFWGIKDIFKSFGTGVKTDRDDLVIDFKKEDLINKIQIATSGNYDNAFKSKYKIENSSSYKFEDKLKKENFSSSNITLIDYRPFDLRYIYYKIGFTSRSAEEVTKHFINNDNIGLIFKRQFKPNELFSYVFVSKNITESCLFESAYANNSCAPLYLYNYSDLGIEEKKSMNFTIEFTNYILKIYPGKTPEEIFYYIYAVLFSPTYRNKYNELLKIDFPRIPFIKKTDIFENLSKTGKRLTNIHLLNENPINEFAKFECESKDYKVTKAEFIEKKIWINDSVYFENISETVWNYYLGGYQVLKKWLDYRKDAQYTLTNTDLKHFINMINIIYETIEIQKEINLLTKKWI